MEKSVRSETPAAKPVKRGMGFYKFAIAIMKPLIALFFRPTVEGREHIPTTGGAFVCANHISNWDVLLLAAAVRRPMHYMAKKELFGVFFVRRLIRALGAFPVNREAADLQSVRTTLTLVKDGELVGVFPQGHRCAGCVPRETSVKGGLGMLVQRTAAPVVPVGIVSRDRRIRLFRRVKIVIGEPIAPETFGELEKTSESYRLIADTVFDKICALEESGHDARQ